MAASTDTFRRQIVRLETKRPGGIVLMMTNILLLGGGCSRPPAENPKISPNRLLMDRKEKDIEFKVGKESPLREEDKRRFQALDYYPPNPEYRFKARLQRYPNPAAIILATNTGERRPALRYGHFEFQVRGTLCRVQVYRMEDLTDVRGPYLFVPFRDATSGKETYGGGRYLDLRENTSGEYDLDFNRAYNPSCAYGKNYSCPVPPSENTLPIPILAGEKRFSLLEGR